MKKYLLLFVFFVLTLSAFAQIDSIWVKTAINNNLPTWFSASGNSERGFAYNPVTNHLLVVSRNGGNSIRILDADNGNDLGQMDLTGVAGGTLVINDIEVTNDGVIFASNLVNDASVFKIYRWANEAAVPTVAFEGDLGGVKRVGDNLSLHKNALDNTMFLAVCDNQNLSATLNHKIYFLTTTNQGVNLTLTKTVTLPPGTMGGAPSVDVSIDGQDTMLITKSAGKSIQAFNMQGINMGTVPGSVVATGATTIRLLNIPESRSGFLATFQYGTAMNNVRIIDTDGETPDYFRTYGITPTTGSNANLNGTGDIEYKPNPDGSITIYVLATNNGIGAYKLSFPYIMNGRMHEFYKHLANKQNNNLGFGSNIDVNKLLYGYDFTAGKLYLGVEGKIDKTNSNGIVFFIGLSNQSGNAAPAGSSLGNVTGGGHLFGVTTNADYKMGFPVNYAFVINPGGSDSVIYLDAAKYTSTSKTGQYLGFCRQSGNTAIGPSSAGIFSANSIAFAFDSAYGNNRGFEIAIPFSEIGNPTPSTNITVFAAVVSSTAFFSDVTIPGSVSGGNPGFNTNFLTLAGGPYYSGAQPLPVELNSFAAAGGKDGIQLNWSTATELNNKGFEIERSADGINYAVIAFVDGKGTSTSIQNYSYNDKPNAYGTYYYRLKQVDFDGTFALSSVVSGDYTAAPAVFTLEQNYPNPFNPTTQIRFSVDENTTATLRVYNALGKEVATLFNDKVNAGENYSVTFDAGGLSSGVYFYKLTQGDKVQTRKLVLMK
ncbi:MAG: T9SS type A sorting domain-containing protein [Ignavibacteriaceae bacterium]|nr:T9SS type A sorting domain-containing protein [Ignavibacteriaceae bacterium]